MENSLHIRTGHQTWFTLTRTDCWREKVIDVILVIFEETHLQRNMVQFILETIPKLWCSHPINDVAQRTWNQARTTICHSKNLVSLSRSQNSIGFTTTCNTISHNQATISLQKSIKKRFSCGIKDLFLILRLYT